MPDKLTFYHNPMSRASIVHWMLEEVQAPYELKLLRFEQQENKSPEFLAINPMGKLPTLVHGDTVVTEAAAICAYLADIFPEKNLCPATTDPRRATYYRWLFFGSGCIEAATLDKTVNASGAVKPSSLGYGSYESTFATLEKALSPGPFLLGEQFTAADVYIGAQLEWLMMFGSVDKRDAFTQYVSKCQERDGYQRFDAARNEQIAALQQ